MKMEQSVPKRRQTPENYPEERIEVYICPFHRQLNVPVELQASSELTELSPSTTDIWCS